MKPRILLLSLLLVGDHSLRAEVDIGRPTSATPYCRYIGSVRQVLARSSGSPSIDEVRSQLRTARRFRYYYNKAQPYIPQAPAVTEARREGDCKAKSLWLADKMSASGVRYVIGKAKPGDRQSHAWLLWSNGGAWLFLDPTMESDVLYADRVTGRKLIVQYSYTGGGTYLHPTYNQYVR